jgi:hypothetical protein
MQLNQSLIIKRFLFVTLLLFSQKSTVDYDNIMGTNYLAPFIFFSPILVIILSILIAFFIFQSIDLITLLVIFPFLFVQGFEGYNRFYLVLFPIYIYSFFKPKKLYLFSLSWKLLMSYFQPVNMMLLYPKFWFKNSLSAIIFIILFLFFADDIIIYSLDLLSPYNEKLTMAKKIITDFSCWKGEGNTGFYSCLFSYQSLVYLFFPVVLKFSIESLALQLLSFRFLFSKYFFLWVVAFLIYSTVNHNIASFYRNFLPIYIYIYLIQKYINEKKSIDSFHTWRL